MLHRLSLGEYFGEPLRRLRAHGLLLTENRFEPNKLIARHEHAYPHLTVVLEGGFDETYDDRTLACRRGAVLVVPARRPHVDAVIGDGAHSLSIELSRGRANRIGRESDLLSSPRVLTSPAVFAAAVAVHAEFRRGSAASPLGIEHAVLGLLRSAIAATMPPAPTSGSPWLDQLVEEIRSDPGRPFSLTVLAAKAGVHPTHLSRTFRRERGCALRDFVLTERIECAARLLRETDQPIGEIAAACGFSDHSHLSRCLRKRFGVTPSSLRGVA